MRLSDNLHRLTARGGPDGADLSGPILDAKGFLVPRGQVEGPREVTIKAPLDELKTLATLIGLYFCGNPAFDNEEVRLPRRALEEVQDDLLRQLRDQGIEELKWDTDGVEQGFRCDPAELSREFVRALRERLSPDEWAQMCSRNREERDGGCCHSHDFCDANQVMWDAVQRVVGREVQFSEAWCTTVNRAWDMADGELRGL